MAKPVKKIKVKKVRKPRQPRRAAVPRKPPVTNISVTIGGGSNQPSGSYYFPDAQQNLPLPSRPLEQPRPRVLEEAALQPFDIIPAPRPEVVEIATQTAPVRPRLRVVADTGSQTTSLIRMNTGSQTQPPLRVVADTGSQTQVLPPVAVAGGGTRRGRRPSEFTTSNKNLAQLQETADSLGIPVTDGSGKNYTKKQLAKMINQESEV